MGTVISPLRGRFAVVATALLTVISTAWCALNMDGPWGPPLLGWIPCVLAYLVMPADLLRLGRLSTLAPEARRFWRDFGVANMANTAGVVVQGYLAVTGRTSHEELPRPTIALFVLAVVILLWALVRLPVGTRTTAEWVRLVLDGATVMAASTVFAWYFAIAPLLERPLDGVVLWACVAAGVLCQVAVAAVVKVILAGSGPVDPAALRIMCFGLFVASFMASFSALLAEHSQLVPSQLVLCPLALTATLAAARQRRSASAQPQRSARRERRPFSLLPYAAVAATQLLLITTVGEPRGRMVVVGGAVVVTSLVVVRQWGAFTDISRLLATVRSQEERLRHQATHDGLTQLANRTLFGERLDDALGTAGTETTAVVLIDLDNFKTVNDRLGHAAGDELLAGVAKRLSGCVRPADVVARLGGDEFAILLTGCDEDIAADVARRILARLAEPLLVEGHRLPVGASVGIAMASSGEDPGDLVRHADMAMYAAKHGGKADVGWYRDGHCSVGPSARVAAA